MAVVTVFAVLLASLLISRVGAVALMLTGMSREASRFQARSAFFGVGFTTSEAESVVDHPVRRRIIAWLILLGNAGIISILGSLVISFGGHDDSTLRRVAILLGGLVVLALLASSRPVDRVLTRVTRRALARWTDLDVRDYSAMLELEDGYTVAELLVEEQDWIAGRALGEVTLRDEGVVVLGIHRDDAYVGAPDGETRIAAGDVLTLYGRAERVAELDRRARGTAGDAAHETAVHEQERVEAVEHELPTAPTRTI